VTGSARIDADPARIYGIIADYNRGHRAEAAGTEETGNGG